MQRATADADAAGVLLGTFELDSIVDIMAPYRGLTKSMVRWIMQDGHFTDDDFHFRRVGDDNRTRRIVHIDFRRDALSKVYTEAEFLGRPA